MQPIRSAAIKAAFDLLVIESKDEKLIYHTEIIPGFPGLMNLLISLLWKASNPETNDAYEWRAYIGAVMCPDKSLLTTISVLAAQMSKPLFDPSWVEHVGDNGGLNNILSYVNDDDSLDKPREAHSLIFCRFLETSAKLKAAVRISEQHGMTVQKIVGLVDRSNHDEWLSKYKTAAVFTEDELQKFIHASCAGA